MICPQCNVEFKGRKFFRSGESGAFRRCPSGHDFKEPPKPRSKTKEQKAIEQLRKFVEEVFSKSYHPEFKKGLASALSVINDDV